MKILGKLESGEVLAALDAADQGLLAAVLEYAGDRDLAAELGARDAAPAGEPEDKAEPAPLPVKSAKPARKVATATSRKATRCKDCGAERASTPWPKAGAVCKACSRKLQNARYHAKQGAKLAPAPKPKRGQDARASSAVSSFGDVPTLPRDANGRTISVGTETEE